MTHLLQACLNGARTRAEHPCIPITAAELAAEARSCVVAGANALHVHPRGDDGKESLQSAHVARCIDTIRKTVPGTPVGIGTGAWIAPDGRARHAHVGAWTTRPDYASVNLC